uniref:Secreted protein n=1 Tax=Neolamprologus brichardi TaxID=32507 RepID=A0A3Q4GWY4_NEOBR
CCFCCCLCVYVCMHACMTLCVLCTHVSLKLSFSFPTIYSSTHASCSPGNDWLFGLVSQLHAYMFSSLPSLSFSLFQACTASHSSTP